MWDVDYPCVEVTYDESDNQGSTQSVTSVVVPATVEYAETLYHVIGIGQRTFIAGHYPRLSSLVLPEGLLYIDDDAIGGRKLPLKSIIIPNTVTTIGAEVFKYSNIESIVLPSSVTYLGDGAFLDCNSLEFVSLSENIQTINSTTFAHCDNLRTVIIPEGVTRIGVRAFFMCPKLTSIHLPNSLREIDREAFSTCAHLTNINFPPELRNMEAFSFFLTPIMKFKSPTAMSVIRERCFYQASLESVTITPNIKSIERSAFEYNENLETVRIEGGVEQIDVDAFASCFHLKDFYCLTDAVPQADNLAFASYKYVIGETGNTLRIELISPTGIAEQATLHVRKSLLNRFQHTYPWSKFKSIVAIEDETAIGPIAIDDESSSTRRVYDLVGRLRRAAQPGLNVIVGSDGRSRKVMVK